MDVTEVTKENVWQYAQNKPSLIVSDLAKYGVPDDVSAKILIARGVSKWLAVRRDLIKLKDDMRDELTLLYRTSENMRKDSMEHRYIVGQIHAIEKYRAVIREMCHSERWRYPEFDKKFKQYLEDTDDN